MFHFVDNHKLWNAGVSRLLFAHTINVLEVGFGSVRVRVGVRARVTGLQGYRVTGLQDYRVTGLRL
jgi:hypothetical protein